MIPKEECNSLSDAQLIKKIAEDSEYLSCVNNKTKEYCIKFMQKQCNGIDIDEIKDIYHDAVLVLYDKAKTGNFVLTCSIQTYLNSICRNQLLNRFKDAGKVIPFPDSAEPDGNNDNFEYLPGIKDWLPYSDFSINGDDDSESGERIRAIMKGLEVMKSSKGNCHELLSLVYWKNNTMQQIANVLDYKDEQNAKNKAYKCREKLKEITFEILNKLR
jgi:RNA polymerase sigma factor (sigma-70 family)